MFFLPSARLPNSLVDLFLSHFFANTLFAFDASGTPSVSLVVQLAISPDFN